MMSDDNGDSGFWGVTKILLFILLVVPVFFVLMMKWFQFLFGVFF